MRKLYEIFKILQNLKKNSFREYYSRKYSIFRDVFSELAGWALAMDLGGILGVQLTLFQLGGVSPKIDKQILYDIIFDLADVDKGGYICFIYLSLTQPTILIHTSDVT